MSKSIPNQWPTLSVAICLAIFFHPCVAGQSTNHSDKSFETADSWSCVLDAQQATFRFWIPETRLPQTRGDWKLLIAGRTLARGQLNARTDLVDDRSQFKFEVEMPKLNPGVSIEATLKVHVSINETLQVARKQLTIFSRDCFSEQQAWLKQKNIQLYDPVGSTGKQLAASHIPFVQLTNPDEFNELSNGVLLIGEGVSLSQNKRLVEYIFKVAHRGIPVLCLAPSDGLIPLSTENFENHFGASKLTRFRHSFLRDFDRRFDTVWWAGGRSSTVAFKLRHAARLDQVCFEVVDEVQTFDWPWIQFDFDSTRKRQCNASFCAMGIISQWDTSPVPRYFLREWLREAATTESVIDQPDLKRD